MIDLYTGAIQISGQTTSKSHDFFTPKDSFLEENPQLFQGNPGW